jgi:hypothetical protein
MESQCNLSERDCIPCKGGIPPLSPQAQQDLLRQLPEGWCVISPKAISSSQPESGQRHNRDTLA